MDQAMSTTASRRTGTGATLIAKMVATRTPVSGVKLILAVWRVSVGAYCFSLGGRSIQRGSADMT